MQQVWLCIGSGRQSEDSWHHEFRDYITLHWLRQTFLLSVWSIVHFWDFSNVSLKLLFNRMHIYSSCICLIFPCCFLDSNACSQVCTQIACLGRCKITLVEFFPTALCLSNASSNHLSERISIHTDCTSVTTVYNYIVQPCVSPNASSNSLPRRCIITVIALKRNVFDWFVISKRWNAVTQAGILKMQMLDTLGKALNEAWYGVLIMLKHIQSSWNFQKAHTQHTGVRHLIWDFVCE